MNSVHCTILSSTDSLGVSACTEQHTHTHTHTHTASTTSTFEWGKWGKWEEGGRKEVVTLAIYTIVIQVMRLCGTSKNAVLQKAVNFHSALPTVY